MWHSARFHSGTSVIPNDIANVSETDLFTLNQLVIWLNNNKLSLNKNETHFTIFTSSKHLLKTKIKIMF